MDVFLKSGKLLDSVIVYAPGSIEHEYIPKQKQVYEYNEKGFQTQALFYNWDELSSNWIYDSKTRIIFENDVVKSYELFSYDGAVWVGEAKKTYVFNANFELVENYMSQWDQTTQAWKKQNGWVATYYSDGFLESLIDREWDDQLQSWRNVDKTFCQYSHGEVSFQQIQSYDYQSSSWVDSLEYTKIVNDDGVVTAFESLVFDPELNTLKGKEKYVNTIDELGRLSTRSIKKWSDQIWHDDLQYSFQYEGDTKNLLSVSLEQFDGDAWQNKEMYQYVENGNGSKFTHLIWNSNYESWVNLMRIQYSVISEIKDSTLIEKWNLYDRQWDKDSYVLQVYDGQSNEIQNVSLYNWHKESNSWMPDVKFENTEEEMMSNSVYSVWNSSLVNWQVMDRIYQRNSTVGKNVAKAEFIHEYYDQIQGQNDGVRELYHYSLEDTLQTKVSRFEKSGDGWGEVRINKYYFKGIVPDSVNGYEKVDLVLYPNPVSDYLKILGVQASEIKAEIFTLNGSKVESVSLQDKLEIDVRNLRSGLYIIKLRFENEFVERKFFKL